MHTVAGAGDDMDIRTRLAHKGHKLDGGCPIINRGDQNSRLIQPRCVQQVGPRWITKEAAKPEFAHHLHSAQIVVDGHGRKPRRLHQTVHNLPKAPDACDDHGALCVDVIGGLMIGVGQAFSQLVIDDEQERGDQHRQGDDKQKSG